MKLRQIMKKEIEDKYYSIPERQIHSGVYLHHVGYKYVYILNTWNKTTIDKMDISEFYHDHFE